MTNKVELKYDVEYRLPSGESAYYCGYYKGATYGCTCSICGKRFKNGFYLMSETIEQTGKQYWIGATCLGKLKTEN